MYKLVTDTVRAAATLQMSTFAGASAETSPHPWSCSCPDRWNWNKKAVYAICKTSIFLCCCKLYFHWGFSQYAHFLKVTILQTDITASAEVSAQSQSQKQQKWELAFAGPWGGSCSMNFVHIGVVDKPSCNINAFPIGIGVTTSFLLVCSCLFNSRQRAEIKTSLIGENTWSKAC